MVTTPKSGLLLAIACIAAIATVGSVFELASGTPELGTTFTSAILALSIPVGGFSFYAAVTSANADQNR